MRAEPNEDGTEPNPGEVWNHAIYRYSTTYQESGIVDGKHVLHLKCDVTANDDVLHDPDRPEDEEDGNQESDLRI